MLKKVPPEGWDQEVLLLSLDGHSTGPLGGPQKKFPYLNQHPLSGEDGYDLAAALAAAPAAAAFFATLTSEALRLARSKIGR